MLKSNNIDSINENDGKSEKRGYAGEVHSIISGYLLMTSAKDSGDARA
jgi:hypothetical protein